ncbi:MAG: class I SAM-dependent methyltransferase [Actinomycetota bacterium]
MINQLVRYAPLLKRLEGERGSILEIGSGPDGIASYLQRQCVGLEIDFHADPDPYLIPVAGSAVDLPFTDRAFDLVLIMDTIEHIPFELRARAVAEAGRVCRDTLIIGGPMGAAARAADDRLAAHYARRGIELPGWLREHLTRRAPDVTEVRDWMHEVGFEVGVEPNEGVRSHLALMRFEVSRFGGRITDRVRNNVPRLVLPVARRRPKGAVYSWLLTGRRPGDPAEVPAVLR